MLCHNGDYVVLCPKVVHKVNRPNSILREVNRMRTTYIAKIADVERKWYVVDATGKTLGRLASEIATVLRGKNKPMYAPNVDTGDYVIVINAEKITVTGKKLDQKIYAHHSEYVGG